MAEGGNFSRSVQDGSNIVFEFECSPCAADGSRFEAFQFCPTCDEFLCPTCIKYHQRLSKSHKLVPAASAEQLKTQPLAKSKPVAAKCLIHPDRDIEMFCGTHDMVYCSLCIAKEHRSCSDVEEVEDGSHRANPSTLQQLVGDVARVNKKMRGMKQEKAMDLNLLQTRRSDLLKEIDALRKEMNDHLDSIERKIKADLDEELTKLEQEIRDEITAADDFVTSTNERKSDLVNKTNNTQMFIAQKIGQKVVSDVETFLIKAKTSTHQKLTFERNTHLYDEIKSAANIGKIVRSRTIYGVKSSKQNRVKVDTDTITPGIIGMCQLQNNTILMADYNNSKLKALDDQLKVKDFCNLRAQPLGICAISPAKVAVRYGDAVQLVHVGQSLTPGKIMKIDTLKTVTGNRIAFCAGNLWACGEKALHMYSMSGTLLKTIVKDAHGRNIFQEGQPTSISVRNDKSQVYVTVWGDRVIIFNKNGDVISELRDLRMDVASSVCVTEDDIVLVAWYHSKKVIMFDRDGKRQGELVSSEDMISKPGSLCYDRKNCRLLVGFKGDNIQIFELC